MQIWMATLLKLIEAVILGAGIVFLSLGNAGGIYEITKGGPSDGFLFNVMFFGFPLIILALCCLPFAINRSPTFRNASRLWFLILIGMTFVVRSLNQRRIESSRHSSMHQTFPPTTVTMTDRIRSHSFHWL